MFTIEGYGTLIANNFVERFQPVASEGDVRIIDGILKLYKNEGYLKPRTKAYLEENRSNFFVTLIDDIVVGCVEKKIIDARTVEIAAWRFQANSAINALACSRFRHLSMRRAGKAIRVSFHLPTIRIWNACTAIWGLNAATGRNTINGRRCRPE